MNIFTEGLKIEKIIYGDDYVTQVGVNGVKCITVCMEYGQCAHVPWAKVEGFDGVIEMTNLSLIRSVTLSANQPEIVDEGL